MAQFQLLPIHVETCSHYLFLLSGELKERTDSNGVNDAHEYNHSHDHHDDYDAHFHGTKAVCSPLSRTILLISVTSSDM